MDLLREIDIDGTINRDDSTKGAYSICCKGLAVGIDKVVSRSNAAWVVVLYDNHCWFFELITESYCCINVENVVVGKLLTVQLLELRGKRTIEHRALVRVFSVAQ